MSQSKCVHTPLTHFSSESHVLTSQVDNKLGATSSAPSSSSTGTTACGFVISIVFESVVEVWLNQNFPPSTVTVTVHPVLFAIGSTLHLAVPVPPAGIDDIVCPALSMMARYDAPQVERVAVRVPEDSRPLFFIDTSYVSYPVPNVLIFMSEGL